jgi:hypothetical protein
LGVIVGHLPTLREENPVMTHSARSVPYLVAGLFVLGALSGCGGGGADVKSDISTTTTGQELMDLKKAYESGAISESEYERERKKILNK